MKDTETAIELAIADLNAYGVRMDSPMPRQSPAKVREVKPNMFPSDALGFWNGTGG